MKPCQSHLITRRHAMLWALLWTLPWLGLQLSAADPAVAEVKTATVEGKWDGEKARLVIQADLRGLGTEGDNTVYGAAIEQTTKASAQRLSHSFRVKVDAVQGNLRDVVLSLGGEGEIVRVEGEGLEDWSVRQNPARQRFLVLRLAKSDKPIRAFSAQIVGETRLTSFPAKVTALSLNTVSPALGNGYVRIDAESDLGVQVSDPVGVVPIDFAFLPESMRVGGLPGGPKPLTYRFHGAAYALPLQLALADPETRQVVLSDFKLTGRLQPEGAMFDLATTARIKNPAGGRIELLGGKLALSKLESIVGPTNVAVRLKAVADRYFLEADGPGLFTLRLSFAAQVVEMKGWHQVTFRVAPTALQPMVLTGLAPETQLQFGESSKPVRAGDTFTAFVPADGQVSLTWKEQRQEAEGKLFYAVDDFTQVAVSPGLMRQVVVAEFQVMQGEISRAVFRLLGDGEVTRVQGPAVRSWSVEPGADAGQRRLIVQLNAAQKAAFSLAIQLQRSLAAFPRAVDTIQVSPEGATRFGGAVRVVNEGAVRLEVLQSDGLSQISPDQLPRTDIVRELLPAQATQVFAFRRSGANSVLRLQADNILPELAVSELLAYHVGETELAIEAELELDIREAPLRELLLRVPRGYAVARLIASDLSDYFTTDEPDGGATQLRLVYGQPVTGRKVIELRLERNQTGQEARWTLPRVEVLKAKSVRGHVGISADVGFRISPATAQGLTEVATAFFPKKITGIQAAFRLSDAVWSAVVNVERLPQTVQADVFHLFSVAEGIAYGSSLVNYLITGAPVSVFRVELSPEYFNVEFTGKNVRSWQKIDGGYQVQLHTPVSGAYALLAAYERPFKPQGERLSFNGARPADAQSEQGYTVVVSTYEFQVETPNASGSLIALEPGELPAEHRLLFDAPILAAYRYTSRPFNLELALKPLAQGEMVSQVVDRASIQTRISEEGQVVTDARLFVKNKGTPHLRVTLPEAAELWSVTVNGAVVVPIQDQRANLIPLPQHPDPDTVNEVQVRLASRAKQARYLSVGAPVVSAPVLFTDWQLEPGANHRLTYRGGSLRPTDGVTDVSSFALLAALLRGPFRGQAWSSLLGAFGFLTVAVALWRSALRPGHYRFGSRHLAMGLLGLAACLLALVLGAQFAGLLSSQSAALPRTLHFQAPVQQPDSALTLQVANLPHATSLWSYAWALFPAPFAVAAWLYGLVALHPSRRPLTYAAGWVLLTWAALRLPQGTSALLLVFVAFTLLQVAWPALRAWWKVAARPNPPSVPAATTVALLAGVLHVAMPAQLEAQPATAGSVQAIGVAALVAQEIRAENDQAFARVKARWDAIAGQVLPLMHGPGVLTRFSAPTNAVRLVHVAAGAWQPREGQTTEAAKTAPATGQLILVAEQTGPVDIEWDYQVGTALNGEGRMLRLPTQSGLVNRVQLTIVGQDVDVFADDAVANQRLETEVATNTVAALVVKPVVDAAISWRPRARDTRREKVVFYAEHTQLFVPAAGVIQGQHDVAIRPAQGEVTSLVFEIPAQTTITAVTSPALGQWRFDPDTHLLRVGLTAPQEKPFSLSLSSQTPAGPLPFNQRLGLLAVQGAASQVGAVGVATGNEVQLDGIEVEALSPINLEDFPAPSVERLQAASGAITLRRGFRHADTRGTLQLKVSAVEPDIRVQSQQTLSLGEDRALLAATLDADITRAGIFKLTFLLPAGMEVESLSGPALSHWTELRTESNRVVTLHLKGKTEGRQQFNISLAGPGVKSAPSWLAPRLSIREATKEQGQLVLVPEQGLKLQAVTREGLTQLDPLKSGIRQKGVLAFRLLQSTWQLALAIEEVDPWIQVTSLQHVTVNEGQLKVVANLMYEIENSGLKSLLVRVPAQAESVRFRGDQLADFVAATNRSEANRDWEIKLHRRMIGKYLLQLTYLVPLAEGATDLEVLGVQAREVNLQRGFLGLQSGGRLRVEVKDPPPALQPTEWQVIPRALQQDITVASANYTYRLVEPAVRLPVHLARHDAARLLPARVQSLGMKSVISDDGVMLTQVRLQLLAGDKRLLHLRLPTSARFWFAFVNQKSVWPWQDQGKVLIPLETNARTGESSTVEFFYSSRVGEPGQRTLRLQLAGPQFDLPLENISWQVYLNERWQLEKWTGTLQLQEADAGPQVTAIDLDSYIQNEKVIRQTKTKEAEQFLSMANRLLERGDPQQARRAFQQAYGLSQHDNAFNEDARVQLHNLKLQQALVGINTRQAKVAGETSALANAPRGLVEGQAANYTQQEAKQIIERNTAEDNATQARLAERIIQQQDAAVANPAAIRATIPEQGRLLTFTRPLEVNGWAELRVGLRASAVQPAGIGFRVGTLAVLFVILAALVYLSRPSSASKNPS